MGAYVSEENDTSKSVAIAEKIVRVQKIHRHDASLEAILNTVTGCAVQLDQGTYTTPMTAPRAGEQNTTPVNAMTGGPRVSTV